MGAYGFQYLGEMAPCKLCYWQRYPHMAAVVIGLFALMVPGRALPRLGALAAFTSAAIGFITPAWKKRWWDRAKHLHLRPRWRVKLGGIAGSDHGRAAGAL